MLDTRVNDRNAPTFPGGPEATASQGGIHTTNESDPRYDTSDFADANPGNLRADSPLYRLTGADPLTTLGPSPELGRRAWCRSY